MEPVPPAATWRENLNTIIAVIALVQWWVYWVWQRFFKRGKADIYETGTVEVGYSNYGPTLALQGTLHGRERGMFVRVISLEVIREADNAQHHFEWIIFRGVRFVTTRPTEMAVMLPAGFLLLPSQPFRYNIVFHDATFQQRHVQPVLETLRAAWITVIGQTLGGAALPTNPQQAQAQIQHAAQAAYPAFSTQPPHVNAYTELDRHFYWTPDGYTLSMRIETAQPERTFTKQWQFQLTPAQSQALRVNALKVVQEICGQYIGDYYFAYAPYEQ